ncbi:MAG TPA: phage baseplate assembly protein V [Rhizomicrobium sp.]|jgi:hypothetical protein|nr:phage baseplate assembly protein V [Rhizomicrobium sp.]
MRVFFHLAFAGAALLMALPAAAGGYLSLHRGIVVSAQDPSGAYRLRVRIPDVTGVQTRWAMPSVPYTSGPVAVPPAGSTVWILFEKGDIDRPVWIGWLPGSAPPAAR